MSSRKFIVAVVASLFVLNGITGLFAHEGGHHDDDSHDSKASRTWTIAAEGMHMHGSFVLAKDGQVQIRSDNGLLRSIAIDRLVAADQAWIKDRLEEIEAMNQQHRLQHVSMLRPYQEKDQTKMAHETEMPKIGEYFKPFEKSLELRWDKDNFYVGSNGLPDHPMMIGIRSWQQQVPIPQQYIGENAWQIPLRPVPAKKPMSTKNDFLRGAIALAVNGVPIFNPLNNRGDDALLFGELDEYGGHCGRADDYHYHIAPVHLEKTVGKGNPIAFALDGYPIYGYQDEKAKDFAPLDALGGQKDADGNYHYHAQKTYPYLNGGFYGEVAKRGGQVDPQPRAEPIRPDLRPLRDAKITEFTQPTPGSYHLVYEVRGKKGSVSYTLKKDGTASFDFVDTNGRKTSQTYSQRNQKGNGPPPPRGNRPPPRDGNGPPPRDDNDRANAAVDLSSMARTTVSGFDVSSTSVDEKHFLSVACTCDGASQAPAVSWKGAPKETKYYAVSIWHTAPDQEKSYWVLYNIPAEIASLEQGSQGVGTVGTNGKGETGYDAMCSKGPGLKKYHITVIALSTKIEISPQKATRENLQNAMKGILLGESTLDVLYER